MLGSILLAAEEAASANPILPEPVELIVGAIVFLIVFVAVAKFAFPPLRKTLESRTEKIQGELERAEQTRTTAEQELASYRKQVAGARQEADRIIEDARRAAEQLRRDAVAKAEQEAAGIVARAQDEIAGERDRVFQELRGQVGELAVDLAGRVVGASLNPKQHKRLVDDFIADVTKSRRSARR